MIHTIGFPSGPEVLTIGIPRLSIAAHPAGISVLAVTVSATTAVVLCPFGQIAPGAGYTTSISPPVCGAVWPETQGIISVGGEVTGLIS